MKAAINNISKFYPLMLFGIVACILLVLGACSDDSSSPNTTDPSNVSIAIEVSSENSGLVMITVTGDNVTSYELDPGDNSGIQSNTTGNFTHTYESTGIYNVEIKAFGESGRFISLEDVVSISLQDDDVIEYPGYRLIWNDEFNGAALDQNFWNYEIGGNGWGNQELQYYRQENTALTGGNLVITAKRESFGGNSFTSSRLTTQDKFSFRYGRADIRAQLPEGQGIWPALWMLGSDFNTVGWPACGEIDIMEMIGGQGRENTVHGTIHWQDPDGNPAGGLFHALTGNSFVNDTPFSDGFHLFSLEWDEREIKWYVDGTLYSTQEITDPDKSEFHTSFFLIFNVAIGGLWPGNPDGTTSFPQKMMVDYVRVYEQL
ncbi:MAG: family 16 glycosylhydrolase [Bacteroidota bacterium]